MRVDLYSKPACSLCDAMRTTLERVRARVPFELYEHDIRLSPEQFAALRYDIPVLYVDGDRAFHHRVDEAELEARLLTAQGTEGRGTAVAQTGGQGEQDCAPPQEESGDS
jgi:hypothetical protein